MITISKKLINNSISKTEVIFLWQYKINKPRCLPITISHFIGKRENNRFNRGKEQSITLRPVRLPFNAVRIATFYFFHFFPFLFPSVSQSGANQLSLREDSLNFFFFPSSVSQETNYFTKETLFFALFFYLYSFRFFNSLLPELIDTLAAI